MNQLIRKQKARIPQKSRIREPNLCVQRRPSIIVSKDHGPSLVNKMCYELILIFVSIAIVTILFLF